MAHTVPLTVMVSVAGAGGRRRRWDRPPVWVPAAQPGLGLEQTRSNALSFRAGLELLKAVAIGDSLPVGRPNRAVRRPRWPPGRRCGPRDRRGARRTARPAWRRRPRADGTPPVRSSAVSCGVEVVDLVVGGLERGARRRVAVDEGVGRRSPELGRDGAHALDHPAGRRCQLGGEPGAGPLGDVLGQVAGALELGHDADDRRARSGARPRPAPAGAAAARCRPRSRPSGSSMVFSPARTTARASVSSPRRASLAAATASDTSANSRTTFWLMASRSRWYPNRRAWGSSLTGSRPARRPPSP